MIITQAMVNAVCSWWLRRTLPGRLARALPDIAARKRRIDEKRRRHKRASSLLAEQREAMTQALRGRM